MKGSGGKGMAAGSAEPFVHLRLRTAYSLLEGALRIEGLAGLCEENAMPALAITDTANLFGAMEFSEALSAGGVQPIIGCALPVLGKGVSVFQPLVACLAKDERGYRHLMELSTLAHERGGERGGPSVPLEAIAERAEGLICLTGGRQGVINQALEAGRTEEAEAVLEKLAGAFGDRLYVELQRHGLEEEKTAEDWLVEAAWKKGLGLAATNDVYFRKREEFEAHDVLLCIASGSHVEDRDRRRVTREHYFKSGEEMRAAFSDLPEAVANTAEIARRSAFFLRERKAILPRFLEGGDEAESDEIRRLARSGLEKRLEHAELFAEREAYDARLRHELDIIVEMRFSGYFLIVADFVRWAREQSIPVGPGRGSGAGSLVAFALGVTDLDPIRFNLFFERFLNPERISMPDFDIDFCQERRDEVIAYVRERYGKRRVANIITFGTLQARAVLRDTGRVMRLPYGQVDRLCKLVPNNPAHPVTLAQALEREPALKQARDEDPQVAKMIDASLKLEGLYRHASTHAAGVVIGDKALDETIPLCRDAHSGALLTQFNMKGAEKAGLVKFDFLGLKTLTAMRLTEESLKRRGIHLDLDALPLDDAETFALLGRGETTGLFQLESGGVRDALRKMAPDRFEDIVALVALYRPGPMDNIPLYISRKKGREKPDFLHASLEPVLKETFGVIIYQEQVMQIAQILSGFTPAEADILRRAMGKKIKSEMDSQKARFVEGAEARGVNGRVAREIFDLVARFAGYGFNKSHAAAYALLAYRAAWLKAHHPTAFIAALMTLDVGNPDKLSHLMGEAARLGVKTARPDVNRSEALFSVKKDRIVYGLAALRNVGLQHGEAIVSARERAGGFSSLNDFLESGAAKMLNKRAFEVLAQAGAFDSLHENRRQIFENSETLLHRAQRARAALERGQKALFSGEAAEAHQALPPCEAWSPTERLEKEMEAAGLYLSGHPLDAWRGKAKRAGYVFRKEALEENRSQARLLGVVLSLRERRSRKGKPFAFLGLSDPTGSFEVLLFSETLAASRKFLEPGSLVAVEAELDGGREEGSRLRAASVRPLEEALSFRRPVPAKPVGRAARPEGCARRWRIFLEGRESLGEVKARLGRTGGGGVSLVLPGTGDGEIEIDLPPSFGLNERIAADMNRLPGVSRVVSLPDESGAACIEERMPIYERGAKGSGVV